MQLGQVQLLKDFTINNTLLAKLGSYMHKVFNAIAIQNFKLSSPRVLATLIYTPAAYHDQLEIISARLILVWS